MPPLGDERNIGELKDLVVQTLETNGVLGHIRAELRAHVYKAIEHEEQATAAAAAKLLRMPEGRLMAELVREFFEFYGFKHSLSVFLPESSLGREGRPREAVGQDAGLAKVEQGRSALEQILELAAGQEEARKGGPLSCGSSTTASTPPPASAAASRAQSVREQAPPPQAPDALQQLKVSPSTAPKAHVAPAAQAAAGKEEEPAGEAPAAAGGPGISFEERAQLDRQMARQLGRRQGGKVREDPDASLGSASGARPSSPGSASGSQPGGGPLQASPAASGSPAASPAASNRSAGSQRSQASRASSAARSSARSSAASSQGSRSSQSPSAPEQVQSFRSDSDRSRRGEVQSFRSDSDRSRQRSPAGAASPTGPSDAGTPASRSGASGGLLGAVAAAGASDEESVSMEDSGASDIELLGDAAAPGGGAGAGAGGFQAASRGASPAAPRGGGAAEDVDELESIAEDVSVHSSIEGYPESDANRSHEEASGD